MEANLTAVTSVMSLMQTANLNPFRAQSLAFLRRSVPADLIPRTDLVAVPRLLFGMCGPCRFSDHQIDLNDRRIDQ